MSWRRGRKGIPGGEQHLAQGPGVGNGQKVRRTSSPSVFCLGVGADGGLDRLSQG